MPAIVVANVGRAKLSSQRWTLPQWASYTLKIGFKIKLREESIYSIQMLFKMKHD